MKIVVVVLVALAAAVARASPVVPAAPAALAAVPEPRVLEEDAYLTMPELVTKYGYPVETHEVTTEDGYILTVFRIPYGKESRTGVPNGKPVYLQHGLLESSDDWILTRPGKALGYILADAGYDVWMSNARGNKWSRRHASLDPNSKAFWDFSWHEMGVYDLPAVIDHILEATGAEQLHYVGHSMGTTQFFVMGTNRPEYNAKIRGAFMLAPIAFMPNARTPGLKTLSHMVHNTYDIFKLIGFTEFLPSNDAYAVLGDRLCSDEAATQAMCANALFLVCGWGSDQLNTTFLPLLMAHDPAGASTKTLIHYAQSIDSGYFRQFDLGSVRNLLKYGSRSPPDYDVSKLTAPVSLIWSDNDWMGVPEDVATLEVQLPNLLESYRVPNEKFNHLDFIFGIDARQLVYDPMIETMNSL